MRNLYYYIFTVRQAFETMMQIFTNIDGQIDSNGGIGVLNSCMTRHLPRALRYDIEMGTSIIEMWFGK